MKGRRCACGKCCGEPRALETVMGASKEQSDAQCAGDRRDGMRDGRGLIHHSRTHDGRRRPSPIVPDAW